MSVLRDAITEAMLAKADESPAIKSKMDEVAEAMAAVGRDLIGELPRMRHSGPTDVSELEVSVNALTPVSQPLYAVARGGRLAGVAEDARALACDLDAEAREAITAAIKSRGPVANRRAV
ncbi:MAG: hypothetical protein FJ286_17405 [Planctomycetes bacterium]|nr:hypothetical protein [Planctomycetota bacterium]